MLWCAYPVQSLRSVICGSTFTLCLHYELFTWAILGFVVGGFPGSFVVHSSLARWKCFIITTPTFHINCWYNSKRSSYMKSYYRVGLWNIFSFTHNPLRSSCYYSSGSNHPHSSVFLRIFLPEYGLRNFTDLATRICWLSKQWLCWLCRLQLLAPETDLIEWYRQYLTS